MQTVGELDTPLGSLVCVAAMVDDVLSLVILAVVGNVRGASGAGALAWRASRPALVSALVCVAGVAAFGLCPPTFAAARTRIPTTLHGRAALFFAFAVTLGLTVAAGEAGSTHLLGAFAGGVAFASVDDAKTQRARNEAVAAWAYSVLFLSVGMQIPLSALFEARGVGLGVGYAVPAVLGKLATALFFANRRDVEDAEDAGNRFVDAADDEGPSSDADNNDARGKSRRRFCSCVSLSPDAFVVGWAMVGRGELGFVMARQAREEGLIGPEPYVASCWALLIATLVAPPLMRRALDARRRKRDAAGAAAGGRGTASSGDASGRAGDSNDRGSSDEPPSGARSNDGPPSGARSNDDPVGERTRGWRLGGLI
jgi:Kef-type K+ transport system membrane component KefB